MNNEIFKDKTLLVIASQFPDSEDHFIGGIFVKQQIEPLKPFFKRIIVIAPIIQIFFTKEYKYCKNYSYDNVDVYFPKCIYIPRLIHRIISKYTNKIFDNRVNVVENLLKQKNITFDLIHAHFTYPSGHVALQLKKKYNIPFVLSMHEDPIWFHEDLQKAHPVWTSVWSHANALVRINKEDLTSLQIYNKETYSIKYGFSNQFVPLDMLKSRDTLHLPVDKKIIFSLGFLSERKGFNYLIDAMAIITKQRSDIICLIGGADPSGFGITEQKLSNQIHNSNLKDYVRLLGPIDKDNIVDMMNSCDIFVLPSLSEAFGIVNLEAMACGKPVISTYNGGSHEIITSEDYGFLVKPADSNALAEKILRAFDTHWDPIIIRRHAEKYSWIVIADQFLEIYQKILVK
jgi:teichuronic acid biosynthesis glycosyltransferase TuaC